MCPLSPSLHCKGAPLAPPRVRVDLHAALRERLAVAQTASRSAERVRALASTLTGSGRVTGWAMDSASVRRTVVAVGLASPM